MIYWRVLCQLLLPAKTFSPLVKVAVLVTQNSPNLCEPTLKVDKLVCAIAYGMQCIDGMSLLKDLVTLLASIFKNLTTFKT